MNQKIALPLLVLTLVGAAMVSNQAFAQTPAQGYTSIIQKLAQRFNLKESEVQSVFDEARTEHQKLMEDKLENRLTQAVKDGKLTETQKQAILAKHKELQARMDAFQKNWQNLTPEQRQAQKQKMITEKQNLRQELEAWAMQNGITNQDIYLFMGRGPRWGWHKF